MKVPADAYYYHKLYKHSLNPRFYYFEVLLIMEQARPLDMLNKARNQRVILELKNGKQLVGKLKAFDIHINVVLDDAEERVDGAVKRKLGTIFIRGDTIILISAE